LQNPTRLTAQNVRFLSGSTPSLFPSEDQGALFNKILIANRGEIACRVMRTAKKHGVKTVAIYSDADKNAMHVNMADEAYHIGPSDPSQSYLNIPKIIDVCKRSGAQGVHPGYGFLSENATFSDECENNGISFIGPTGNSMRMMASKSAAKILMTDANVPVVPGYHGEGQELEQLQQEAEKIGFPVLIKAVLGGGGKGMRIVEDAAELKVALELAQREAASSFGDSRILIEKYIRKPRHVEVQVFSDKHDNHVYLWDRDCSVQRRYQKIIEEAPAPGLDEDIRREMGQAAVNSARAVNYNGAGTVEFILDRETDKFYFMEMNTRLQVEHPVSEMITQQDLVLWQLKVAAGHPLPLNQDEIPRIGHSVESRIYAESPARDFMPGSGTISYLRTPTQDLPHVRVDTGIREGDTVSVFYDPMIAKLITWDTTRERAMQQMRRALASFRVSGLNTNISFLESLTRHQAFLDEDLDTGFIPRYKDDLFPPSKPTDDLHFALTSFATLLDNQKGGEEDPWGALDDLRVNHKHTHTFNFLDTNLEENQGVQVNLESQGQGKGYSITITRETSNEVVEYGHIDGFLNSDGYVDVVLNGKREKCSFKRNGDNFDLFMDEDRASLTFKPIDLGADDGSSGGSLLAPVTGVVKSVKVKKGDHVEKGDSLVVMSAMKMEFIVQAPSSGVVDSVLCLEGETVDENKQVVLMETKSE